MNFKKLSILIIVFIALGLYFFFYEVKKDDKEKKAEEDGREPATIMEEKRRNIMEIPLIKKHFPEETED